MDAQNSCRNIKYEKLEEMPNIGKIAAQRLREVGIETPEQLCAVGSREALLRLRERGSGRLPQYAVRAGRRRSRRSMA